MIKKIISHILILSAVVGISIPLTPWGIVQAETKACYSMPSGTLDPNILMEATCQPPTYKFWGTADEAAAKAASLNSTPPSNTNTNYVLLAPLPNPSGGTLDKVDVAGNSALGGYLNIIIKLTIGIAAVLAMLMIVMGGIEYMTSELISSKEEGKKRITNAVFGLILALGSWLLLNTVNPDLLKTDLTSLTTQQVNVKIDVGGESSTPFVPINSSSLQSLGITCNDSGGSSQLASIGQSFIGRATYSQAARNTTNSSTAFVDCSSFVSQVYTCAGLPNPGGTTLGIFGSGSTSVTNISADGTTVNGTALKVGDLLGWKAGENGEKNGHVVMYIGNGQVIDAQPSGVAVRSLNSTQFQGRIKYIKQISRGGTGGGF